MLRNQWLKLKKIRMKVILDSRRWAVLCVSAERKKKLHLGVILESE